MKTEKNSDGFSAIYILLFTIIIGIIGFTGWYVESIKQDTDNTLTPSSASRPAPQKAASSVKESSACNQGNKQRYLEVNVNSGFKVPLSSPICDAYYMQNNTTEREDQGAIGFKSLDGIAGCKVEVKNSVTGANGSLTSGAINISFDAYDPLTKSYGNGTSTSGLASDPDSFRVGSDYFQLSGDCTSTDAQEQQKIVSIQKAFIEASKNSVAL